MGAYLNRVLRNVLRTGGVNTGATFGDNSILTKASSGEVFKLNPDQFTLSSSGAVIYANSGDHMVEWFSNGNTTTLTYSPADVIGLSSRFFTFTTTAGGGFQARVDVGQNGSAPPAAWDILHEYPPESPDGGIGWYLNRRAQNQWQISAFVYAWSDFYNRGLFAGFTYTKDAGQDPRGTYNYVGSGAGDYFVESGLTFGITGTGYLGPYSPGTLTIS